MDNNIVEVVTVIDDDNKIYYTEYIVFNDENERNSARLEMIHYRQKAKYNGNKIIRIENGIKGTLNTDYSEQVIDNFINSLDSMMNSGICRRKIG